MPIPTFKQAKYGVRRVSAIVSITVALTPVNLYLQTVGRTDHIRKIHIFNRNAAPTIVMIGTGLGGLFAQQIGAFYAVNGQDLEITQDQIPEFEFSVNITCQVTVAAVAPNDVLVQVEVEEYQGPTG